MANMFKKLVFPQAQAKRRTFHETNQRIRVNELRLRKVRRLAQLSSSELVWIVQHVLWLLLRTDER